MEEYQVPVYDDREGWGLIRHVYVRSNSQGEALACILAKGRGCRAGNQLITCLVYLGGFKDKICFLQKGSRMR